ncbi:hypothetical protein D9M72_572310 [compost metagenome]
MELDPKERQREKQPEHLHQQGRSAEHLNEDAGRPPQHPMLGESRQARSKCDYQAQRAAQHSHQQGGQQPLPQQGCIFDYRVHAVLPFRFPRISPRSCIVPPQ